MDAALHTQIDELRRVVATQQVRIDQQAAVLAAIAPSDGSGIVEPPRSSSRRDLLRLGGVAAAGAVGSALVGSRRVAATTGDQLIAGQTEDAESQTTLVYDGPPLATGGAFVVGTGTPPTTPETAGVIGYSTDGNARWGVHGTSVNAAGGGVLGSSPGAGAGVAGRSTAGPDLVTSGTGFLRLGSAGHSIPSITPQAGDLFRMDDHELFYTTATGPPAQIVNLIGNVGGFVFLDVPLRVVDTRLAGGSKLQPGTVRTFSFQTSINDESVVPEGSRAAMFTVTVDATEGAGGFLTVYAADQGRPEISSVNWFGPNQILANTTFTRVVRPTGQVNVFTGANRTHMIIDVIGYYN